MHISPWFAGRKEKSMKYLNKVVEIILEVLVAGMVLGCCWQVITRFVLHNPSKYTEELLRYMLIWLTMMGVPYAYGQNSHLAINLIVKKFKPKNETLAQIAIDVLIMILSVSVMIIGGIMVTANAAGQLSPAMQIPMQVYYVCVPVSFSIISASLVTLIMFLTPHFGVFISAQKMVTGIDSFTLLAVPFFVLAGLLMSNGGIAKRLINLAMLVLGKVPGSLAMTNIAGNAMFGSISGSGIAAATAIGGVMQPLENEQGYDRAFSAAANVASAPVGQLIPPTASFIVFSAASGGVSVAALLMAGWIPGLLWALLCMVVAFVYGKKHGYVIKRDHLTAKVVLKTIWDAIPSLFLIVIIIGGILSGYFTPTEASGVAVVYAFILAVFVYKSIRIKDIPRILKETAVMTAIVMLIIGASSVLSFVLSFTGLPQAISAALLGVSDNKIVILLIINLILLIVGTFMDMAPALLIFTPIFLPVVKALGMNPIQFGVMMVMNLSIGTITPPVGSVLFVGCSISHLQVEEVIKKLVPFFVAILVALLFVTFVPQLSMWLPTVFGLLG